MFDPKKYDNTESGNKGSYMEKRDAIIVYLNNMKSLIKKECELLDSRLEEISDEKTKRAFTKKLDGWSRILNGTDILNHMYLERKETK